MENESSFKIEKIKPGILVGEYCSLKGGITYIRKYNDTSLEGERLTRKYDAEVVIQNVKERKEGERLRANARYRLRTLCADTPVGLICALENSEKLKLLIKDIREKINSFNSEATTCRILARYAFYHVKDDNAGAIAAISNQLVDIANSVQEAIKDSEMKVIYNAPKRLLKGYKREEIQYLDDKEKDGIVATVRADRIRNAVSEAKCIDQLLVTEAKDKVSELIRESKYLARKIKKDVIKHERELSSVLKETDLTGIDSVKTVFFSAMLAADKENEEELISVKEF